MTDPRSLDDALQIIVDEMKEGLTIGELVSRFLANYVADKANRILEIEERLNVLEEENQEQRDSIEALEDANKSMESAIETTLNYLNDARGTLEDI